MPRMTGAECLADMLQGYGVTHVFMVPAVLRQTFAEMERRTKIKRIHTPRREVCRLHGRRLCARLRRPGICMAQVIGALNLAAGLRDAYLAHSPVLAFTGGRDPKTKFRKVYQEVDDVPAFAPVTKFNATVDAVERIPDMVRQAFRVAVSGSPGPVHLQFRGNEGQIDQEQGELEPLCDQQFMSVPPFRPRTRPAARAGGARSAAESRAPGHRRRRRRASVGRGIRACRVCRDLVRFRSRPRSTARSRSPDRTRLSVGVVGSYSRESANRVVASADLVCFVGTETGGMTTHFWSVPKIGVPAIQIDIDPEALGRNYPLQAAVLGDAKWTLTCMRQQADAASAASRQEWIDRRARICREWTDKYLPGVRIEWRCRSGLNGYAASSRAMCPMTPSSWSNRPCGHVDGRNVQCARAEPRLHPQRRPSGMGVSGRARRQMCAPGAPGRGVHRRRRVLVSHRRGRDRRALGHQDRHRRQQQQQRQSVETRLRPGLWRPANGGRAPALDLQPNQFARLAEDMGASASGSSMRASCPPRLKAAFAADRAVVIDVVTDIDALAPLAVCEP